VCCESTFSISIFGAEFSFLLKYVSARSVNACRWKPVVFLSPHQTYPLSSKDQATQVLIMWYQALSDKKVTCIEANNTISTFSHVDHMLQVNFQEGESCLLQYASVDVPDLCSNRFEKALLPNINNDAKPRMICSQEGEKGIECLHIKFTLAEDVFESRTIQKQGENAECMCESRTTQMQERENDEDITNMDTPTVVAYDSKVKLFFSIGIFNTFDE
jgi:Golgi nucleoside diphosphatase